MPGENMNNEDQPMSLWQRSRQAAKQATSAETGERIAEAIRPRIDKVQDTIEGVVGYTADSVDRIKEGENARKVIGEIAAKLQDKVVEIGDKIGEEIDGETATVLESGAVVWVGNWLREKWEGFVGKRKRGKEEKERKKSFPGLEQVVVLAKTLDTEYKTEMVGEGANELIELGRKIKPADKFAVDDPEAFQAVVVTAEITEGELAGKTVMRVEMPREPGQELEMVLVWKDEQSANKLLDGGEAVVRELFISATEGTKLENMNPPVYEVREVEGKLVKEGEVPDEVAPVVDNAAEESDLVVAASTGGSILRRIRQGPPANPNPEPEVTLEGGDMGENLLRKMVVDGAEMDEIEGIGPETMGRLKTLNEDVAIFSLILGMSPEEKKVMVKMIEEVSNEVVWGFQKPKAWEMLVKAWEVGLLV